MKKINLYRFTTKVLLIGLLFTKTVCAYSGKDTQKQNNYQTLEKGVKNLYDTKPRVKLSTPAAQNRERDWNFVVYIAANNNLHKFAQHNMLQMFSTPYVNTLVQLDLCGQKKTYRYFLQKDNPNIVESYETTHANASGTAASLFDCIRWAKENYPAKHTALIIWNHGSGISDPHIWGRYSMTHRDELFFFNPETCLLELDRSAIMRGIAFNDKFETFITNTDLKNTLERACQEIHGGKKIDIVGMDACHMAMIEIASQIKKSANFMVGSQEVEPGRGWNYQKVLQPLTKKSLSPREFASHMVYAYRDEYQNVLSDFTQSAINLDNQELLEENVHQVSLNIINFISQKKDPNIMRALKQIRTNHRYTTAFYNHNYIDLMHFYHSLLERLSTAKPQKKDVKNLLEQLKNNLYIGCALMEDSIIANASGQALPGAYGLAIYFPTRTIHDSYLKTVFAKNTAWIDFLALYHRKRGHVSLDTIDSQLDQDFMPTTNQVGEIIREQTEEQ